MLMSLNKIMAQAPLKSISEQRIANAYCNTAQPKRQSRIFIEKKCCGIMAAYVVEYSNPTLVSLL
jgi:hypothetical protein